jgi:AcrR family transcriptional regulator
MAKIVRKKKKPDRRIERTKQLLRNSLMQLVTEKMYEEITVQDILDRANVGRSTFYAHFEDRDELLVSCFEHLQKTIDRVDEQLKGHDRTQATNYHPTLAFFLHAAEQHRFYKAMLGNPGGEIVQRYLYKYLLGVASRHLETLRPKRKTAVPKEILAHHIASSFLAILTWWLQHDMPYTAEKIDSMYYTLTLPGINAGLGK